VPVQSRPVETARGNEPLVTRGFDPGAERLIYPGQFVQRGIRNSSWFVPFPIISIGWEGNGTIQNDI